MIDDLHKGRRRHCGVAAAAHRRPWSADAGIGSGVRHRIRWPASSGRPGSRERATYVPGRGRCERPRGRWHSRSEPGCGASSRVARSSLADRIRGEEKIFCCVTTRRPNFGVLNGFRRDFSSPPAHLFGLGMPRFDTRHPGNVSPGRAPPASGGRAAGIPGPGSSVGSSPRLVLVPHPFASRSAGEVAALSADGCGFAYCEGRPRERQLPREKLGENVGRILLGRDQNSNKTLPCQSIVSREQDRELTVSSTRRNKNPRRCRSNDRLPQNKTERYTGSPDGLGTRTPSAPFKRSPAREQDREINGLIDGRGTRTPSAAIQTIACSRTRQRNKRSHRRAGNKNPERCLPNHSKRCRIRDRSQMTPTPFGGRVRWL